MCVKVNLLFPSDSCCDCCFWQLSSIHCIYLSKYLYRFWNSVEKNPLDYSTWELDLTPLNAALLQWSFIIIVFVFAFKLN